MIAKLRLTIVDPGGQGPALRDPDDPEVQVWRDRNREICAYGYTADGHHWLHIPALATYRFNSHSDEVAAIAVTPLRVEAIRDIYRRAVLPLALQAQGIEVLHASAVLSANGVVGWCAASGTGKSTIAYGLSRRGYSLWADDAVAFQVSGPGVHAIRLPFRVRLLPDAAASLHFEGGGVGALRAESHGADHIDGRSHPVAALGVLKRSSEHNAGVHIERLPPSAAFPSLLAHAYCFGLLDGDRKRRMMERYLALCARISVFEIRFRPGLQTLPAVLDRIEQVMNDPRL